MIAQSVKPVANSHKPGYEAFALVPWQQATVFVGRLAFYSCVLSVLIHSLIRWTTPMEEAWRGQLVQITLFCSEYLVPLGFAIIILAIHPYTYRQRISGDLKQTVLVVGWLLFATAIVFIFPLSRLMNSLNEHFPGSAMIYGVAALGPYLWAGGVVPNPFWPIFPQRFFLVPKKKLEAPNAL